MIYFFTGTDRDKARAALNKATSLVKNAEIVRITDANTLADLQATLQGGGMFGGKRVVVLENVFSNEEMRTEMIHTLPRLSQEGETFYIYEEKPDAATRKSIEKHSEKSERFDAVKKVKRGDIFALANAQSQGDKKSLWVGYQEALARDEAPEAIHGVLFWGAKQMVLSAQPGTEKRVRGERMVAELAELPHKARRKGFDLEYALEKYILSVNKS